jgi:DNA-binding NarL/FixJ family response regulator
MNSGLRVLVVDDHDGFRSILASFLDSHAGVEAVIEAIDGNDAIEKANLCHPDLVLMDIRMPNRNGIDATRAIKALNPETVVLMMSMDSSEDYVRSAQLVADGYVPKASVKKSLSATLEEMTYRWTSGPVIA